MLIVNLWSEKWWCLYHSGSEADLIARTSDDGFPKDYDGGQDNCNYETQIEQRIRHDGDNETGPTILAPGQILPGTGFRVRSLKEFAYNLPLSFDDVNGSHPPPPSISLTARDVTRWKMTWRAFLVYKRDNDRYWLPYRKILVPRCSNWPDLDDFRELPIALGFSAAALVYGGLHALAWFAHFGSFTEQLLWRISASVVMGGVPVAFIIDRIWVTISRDHTFFNRKFIIYFETCLFRSILLAYILARAYLVVECFINLSHLPADVYDVPTWSAYFPHIS